MAQPLGCKGSITVLVFLAVLLRPALRLKHGVLLFDLWFHRVQFFMTGCIATNT